MDKTYKESLINVVKKSVPYTKGLFIEYDKLILSDSAIVDRYYKASESTGEVLGIIKGDFDWDIRLVLAEHGAITLLRCTDPVLSNDKDTYYLAATVFSNLLQLPGTTYIDFLENMGQLWLKRYYVPYVLDVGQFSNYKERFDVFRKLFILVEQLHKIEIIHGHICPENIYYDAGNISLLDPAFCIFSRVNRRRISGVAPELLNLLPANDKTDVYGLGLIAKMLGLSYIPHDKSLVERMLSEKMEDRPSMYEVKEKFIEAVYTEPSEEPQNNVQSIKQEIKKIPVEKSHSTQSAKGGSPWNYAVIVLAAILAYLIFYYRGDISESFSSKRTIDQNLLASYQSEWQSGLPSLMQKVAVAAVADNNREAQLVITQSVMQGKEQLPQVRVNLLKIAFNPRWEAELSDNDRRIILNLALGDLLKGVQVSLPQLSKAHPGIIFAITANLDLTVNAKQLADIPLQKLTTLPSPYGSSFAMLNKYNIAKRVDDIPARALAHILSGDISNNTLLPYFTSGIQTEKREVNDVFTKLAILISLSDSYPNLTSTLYDLLMNRVQEIGDLLRWFQIEDNVSWSGISERGKLLIVSGFLPNDLSFEQLADLLLFPRKNIKELAKQGLIPRYLPESANKTVDYIINETKDFTRSQVLTLLAALSVKDDSQYEFLSKWFAAKPNIHDVLELLLIRASIPEPDPFNIEAARYLSRNNITLSFVQIQKLVMHSEKLARAMAYSHLRVDNKQELDLLKRMINLEPDRKLKDKLIERVGK